MHYQKGTQENIEIKVHVRWMNHLYDGDAYRASILMACDGNVVPLLFIGFCCFYLVKTFLTVPSL